MEFEEMQKIWDSQRNEALYVLNENALHNRIMAKKRQSGKITNFSELMGMIVNTGAGVLMFQSVWKEGRGNIYLTLLGAWMICTALAVLFFRIRRLNGNAKFDRSMLGDLSYALSTATYQVKLGSFLRWNIVPMGVLISLGFWDSGNSPWLILGVMVFLAITNYFAGWEQRYYYNRKRELATLYDKLIQEP
jgi:hypothetical protein